MGTMDDLIRVAPAPPPNSNELERRRQEERKREDLWRQFLYLADEDCHPEDAWRGDFTPLSDPGRAVERVVIRRLSQVLQELRDLRMDLPAVRVPERERKDYTLPLGSACLGVLVLMLLFK